MRIEKFLCKIFEMSLASKIKNESVAESKMVNNKEGQSEFCSFEILSDTIMIMDFYAVKHFV